MKQSHKGLLQIVGVALFIAVILLLAFLFWRQRTNQTVLIEQEQAFQYAIHACNPSYGLQQVEEPTEYQAELTTYQKALGFAPIPSKANRSVWVVKMRGRWLLVGGPLPDPASNPEPAYWDECTQIIDAQTGESLSYPIE